MTMLLVWVLVIPLADERVVTLKDPPLFPDVTSCHRALTRLPVAVEAKSFCAPTIIEATRV